MTEELLNRLEALEKAATKGPWDAMTEAICTVSEVFTEDDVIGEMNGNRTTGTIDRANVDLICAMRNALPELITLARKGLEREWIPVAERLPESDCLCLVITVRGTDKPQVTLSAYSIIRGWVVTYYDSGEQVTAWQPLPAPFAGKEAADA